MKKTKKPAVAGDIPEKEDKSELGKCLADIRKLHGPNIITRANVYPRHNHISTGVFMLDMATGGGLPEGHPANYFGWENSGKTTCAMKAVAGFQKKHPDRKCLWVAMEEFDPLWAEKHGVDTQALELARPDSGEQAVDIINGMSRVDVIGMIVLDSIANLVSMKMAEASAEDKVMAHIAALAGPMCSKLSQSFLKERKRGHTVTVLNINQWRYKIGMVFGDPRVLPGGVQTNFFHSTKIELKNKEKMVKDARGYEIVDRCEHTFEIKKAKISSVRSGAFDVSMNPDSSLAPGTVDDAETIASFAKDLGFFERRGNKQYFAPFDWTLENREDVISQINSVNEFRVWLAQACIAQYRVLQNGLPPFPKDNHLYGHERMIDADFDFVGQKAKAAEAAQAKADKGKK